MQTGIEHVQAGAPAGHASAKEAIGGAVRTRFPLPLGDRLRGVAGLALFALAYSLAYHYGMSFTQAAAAPFWFPDSVLLCALLVIPVRRWWIFLLVALPIRLFAEVSDGVPLWFLLATYANDAVKGVVAAYLLRRSLADPVRIATVRELSLFALIAVLLVPAASAFGGAAARQELGADYWTAWEQWFLGDALAHLVITPAILYWGFGDRRAERRFASARWLEVSALAVGVVAACWLAFLTEPGDLGLADPRYFLPIPFLLWAATRFGMAGAAGGVTTMAFFCVVAALGESGPFAGESPAETARILQQFLVVRAPALYLVAVVVQQMREVQRSLGESEDRFRSLADTTPVLMWISDADERLTFANRSWLEYTGGTREEVVGASWRERAHPEDAPRLVGTEDERTRVSGDSAECRLRGWDGVHRWFLVTRVPRTDLDGRFLGFIGSCMDLSAQKEAALEMQRNREELAHVARVATVGVLTASVAHELRQPLAAILLNAQSAEMVLDANPRSHEELREILRAIRSDDRRAGAIIDRIRGLLVKHEIVREPVALNEVAAETLRLLAYEASERGVPVRFEPAAGLPQIVGDRVHLQQLLMNLILNGLEALASVPDAERRLVVRTAKSTDGGVEIRVSDSGPGIPEEAHPNLFEPFWTTKQGGLGMGLSIARSIVDAHGGKIRAESAPGTGATFCVELPAAGDAAI